MLRITRRQKSTNSTLPSRSLKVNGKTEQIPNIKREICYISISARKTGMCSEWKGIAEMVSFPEWETTTCYQEEQLELWNYYYYIHNGIIIGLNYGIILLLLLFMWIIIGLTLWKTLCQVDNQAAKAHSKTNMCMAEAGRVRWVAFPETTVY